MLFRSAHEPIDYPKKRIEVIAGSSEISNIKLFPEQHIFLVNAKNTSTILDRTYFYPGWRVSVDNNPSSIEFQDQNYRGLITFSVPKGNHKIVVYYLENQLQRGSDLVSILTIGILMSGFFIFHRKKST